MLLKGAGIIKIKKRSLPQWLTFFVFVMPFFLPTMLQFFHLPGLVKYTIDVGWIGLLALMCIKKHINASRQFVLFATFVIFVITYSFIVYLFNFQSIFYFLWGVRNNFRFYIAFLACILFFEVDDTETILGFFDILFWINIAVSLVQFFFLGFEQDFLGGIFGVETGSNASTLIFFSIVLMRSILLCFEGKEKIWICILKCALSLLIAALAELKGYYLLFAVVLLLSIIMTRASWKKVALLVVVAVLMIISNSILFAFFESNLSLDNILRLITATSYSSQQDLGRFTAISTISDTFLTDASSQLFGLGIGNCDTSAFSICNTPFFVAHQDVHYSWFSSAFIYLETGYIGFVLHFAFYAICFISAFKMLKRKEGNRLYHQMSIIMAILCVILVFYNSSLRTEAGYMAYFVLALPFVGAKNDTAYAR